MIPDPKDVAEILDIEADNWLDIAAAVETGLPVFALDAISWLIARNDWAFSCRIVSASTLRRRRKSGRLSQGESDKVARLVRAYCMVMDHFNGAEHAARMYLLNPKARLGDRSPADLVIGSDAGLVTLLEILSDGNRS